MKKFICIVLAAAAIISLSGCGNKAVKSSKPEQAVTSAAPKAAGTAKYNSIDVDLTSLSKTVVYSEVYNMMTEPSDYIGKTVKMNGMFNKYCAGTDADGNPIPEQTYYACVIADATACCQQGLEFILSDGEEYPEEYSDITVTGVFQTYYEGEKMYCHLVDAVIA